MMRYPFSQFTSFLFFLVCSTILLSCKETDQILSKEEAIEVAHKIDSSIQKKQPRYVNEILDADLLSERIAKAKGIKNSRGIAKSLKKYWKNVELGDKILVSIGDDGHYKFVKHYEKEGKQHLIFRVYGNDGLNYHDLELAKYKGEPRVADVFVYANGESFSETMAGLFSTFLDIPTDKEADDISKSLVRMKDLMEKEEYEKAESYYKSIPANIKKQRTVQLYAITLYREIDHEKFLEAIQQFRKDFANVPTIDLLLIDAYLVKEEYDKAIEAIDNIDRFINKDPFLDYYRGLVYNTEGSLEKAINCFEKTVASNPDFGEGMLELIAANIKVKKHVEANRLVGLYKSNKAFDQELLDNYLFLQDDFEYTSPAKTSQ